MQINKVWFIGSIVVLVAVFSLVACPPGKFKAFKEGNIKGVIIAKEQAAQLKYFPEKVKEFWTPSKQNALEADRLAQIYLRGYKSRDPYTQSCIPDILSRLGHYKRQYVGLVEKEGDKVIWINYFYDSGHFSYWTKDLVYVFDGGRSFFRIKVNLDKNKCYDLSINGEG